MAGHTRLEAIGGWEHVEGLQSGHVEPEELTQRVLLEVELFLGGLSVTQKLHGLDSRVKCAQSKSHFGLFDLIGELLLEQDAKRVLNMLRTEVLLVGCKLELNFTHLEHVCDLLFGHIVGQVHDDLEL